MHHMPENTGADNKGSIRERLRLAWDVLRGRPVAYRMRWSEKRVMLKGGTVSYCHIGGIDSVYGSTNVSGAFGNRMGP